MWGLFHFTGPIWGNETTKFTGGFSSNRPVMRSFDIFFLMYLNLLNKQLSCQISDVMVLKWRYSNALHAKQVSCYSLISVLVIVITVNLRVNSLGGLRWYAALLTHPPWTKWPTFRRPHFQMHFHGRNVLYFDSNFIDVRSQGSNWQYVSIGSGNCLEPKQATSHYLDQCQPSSPIHICSTRGTRVKVFECMNKLIIDKRTNKISCFII